MSLLSRLGRSRGFWVAVDVVGLIGGLFFIANAWFWWGVSPSLLSYSSLAIGLIGIVLAARGLRTNASFVQELNAQD